ncbi:hypothetical protein FBQ97_05385 [Acidobacteria bacterium ACD]|nr:MAG: hypothetical protein EDX89_01795 [Acidobacteriota bacterium]MDL1949232.1 hypothetical protein [Acidobacteria bacterium ACD]
MRIASHLRTAVAALPLSALLGTAPLLAQGAPVGGTIRLGLTPSAEAAAPGASFTVDLTVDMTAATGTCGGSASVPVTLGAYNLGIRYDASLLSFVGTAACPSAPGEFRGAPPCANNTRTPAESFVNCNAVNPNAGTAATTPQGDVCVVRVTFKRTAAGAPARLSTLHTGGTRGIATAAIGGCGGPVTFPAADVAGGEATVSSAPN